MNTDFPEYLFEPSNKSLFNYKTNLGEQICKKNTIIFCGICRDVEHIIERNILRLIRAGSLFKDFHIFIYENDSKDKTKEVLEKYKSDKITIISEKRDDQNYGKDLNNGIDPWHYNRCKILADCRNKYLSYIKDNIDKYDFCCVVDLDLKGGWSYEGIKHSIFTISQDDLIACVSSYGIILSEPYQQYDIEDVDPEEYIMYDSFAFRPIGTKKIKMLNTPIFNNIKLHRGDDILPVFSNFGGMAIYKTKLLNNKKYGAKRWEHEQEVDPDHVVLNRSLIEDGYKIVLDPNMISLYSNHQFCYD